jgi:hypothetical protein
MVDSETNVERIEEVEEVPKVEKLTESIKVTEENRKRLTSLAGELTRIRGEFQSHNDAITYLFQNQKEKEKSEG